MLHVVHHQNSILVFVKGRVRTQEVDHIAWPRVRRAHSAHRVEVYFEHQGLHLVVDQVDHPVHSAKHYQVSLVASFALEDVRDRLMLWHSNPPLFQQRFRLILSTRPFHSNPPYHSNLLH